MAISKLASNVKSLDQTNKINEIIDDKQDLLVSGTNIKTINSNSLLGEGNIEISGSLPSQSGNSGKFLTTDGTDASWATVDALPSQTGNSGKFLTTNGSTASWATVDALPSQSGQSGKFLTTDGTDASWTSITPVNDATLTITQNNTTIGTFTANASSNATIALTDTTYSTFTGATSSVAGASGLVPAPTTSDVEKFLKGDGTWASPTIPAYSNTCPAIAISNNMASWTVTHNLNTSNVLVSLYKVSSGAEITKNITINNDNSITLTFGASSNISAGDYKVVVLAGGATTLIQSSRNIGEVISSTIPLTDGGVHLLDGALISRGTYAAFVDYIASLVSIYPDLFETEANWQSSVTTYGVCGKFVYDSTNQTVRLPKITGFTEGTTDVTALGDLIQAGLPNITGSITGTAWRCAGVVTGALSSSTFADSSRAGDASSGISNVYFNASNSNSIYGNSTTVQPQAIKVFYYIVIATSAKLDIQMDIDNIATDLNGKADNNLDNVSNTLSNNFFGKMKPDYASGINLPFASQPTMASTTTFTCPSAGCIYLYADRGSSSGYTIRVYINGNFVVHFPAFNAYAVFSTYLYVNKNDVVFVDTDHPNSATWTIQLQKFYPLIGA